MHENICLAHPRYTLRQTDRVCGGRARLVQRARSTVGPRVLQGTTDCRSHSGKHADQTLC